MISKEELEKIKEKIEFLYNYQFEDRRDLPNRLKPLTDNLLFTIEALQKEVEIYKVALKAAGISQGIIDLIGEPHDPT